MPSLMHRTSPSRMSTNEVPAVPCSKRAARVREGRKHAKGAAAAAQEEEEGWVEGKG